MSRQPQAKHKSQPTEQSAFSEPAKDVTEQSKSQRYSTGYRLALYDPIDPNAPLRDCVTGARSTYPTLTTAQAKQYRGWVLFANDMLYAAGARLQVGIFPAALTGFCTCNDGDFRNYFEGAEMQNDAD